MPVDLDRKAWSVDSNIAQGADTWSVVFASANRFLARTLTDTQTIEAGAIVAGGGVETVPIITNGPVMSYELDVLPANRETTLGGYDQGKLLRQKHVWIMFRRFGGPGNPPPIQIREILPGQILPPVIRTVPQFAGPWSAKTIAEFCAGSKGVSLQWQSPDYEFVTDFLAQGSLKSVIERLIGPWGRIPGIGRVFVFHDGARMVVNSFENLIQQSPAWSVTLPNDLAGLKRLSLSVRHAFPDGVPGLVIVRGRPLTTFGGTTTEQQFTYETTDMVIEAVYEEPGHILKRQTVTYKRPTPASTVASIRKEELVNEYDTSSQRRQIAGTLTRTGVDPRDTSGAMRTLELQREGFSYDAAGFLLGQRTFKQVYDPASTASTKLRDAELQVRICEDIGPEVWMDSTHSFVAGATGQLLIPSTGNLMNWPIATDAIDRNRTPPLVQTGYRPFGPGRRGGSGGVGPELILIRQIGSGSDPDHILDISDRNLSQEDAGDLASAIQRALQKRWEIEASFEAVNQPWIRRGSTIQFGGITTESGAPITIPRMVVTEVRKTNKGLVTGLASTWTT